MWLCAASRLAALEVHDCGAYQNSMANQTSRFSHPSPTILPLLFPQFLTIAAFPGKGKAFASMYAGFARLGTVHQHTFVVLLQDPT